MFMRFKRDMSDISSLVESQVSTRKGQIVTGAPSEWLLLLGRQSGGQNRHPSDLVPGRQTKVHRCHKYNTDSFRAGPPKASHKPSMGSWQHNRHPHRLIAPVIFIIRNLRQCDSAQSSVMSMTQVTLLSNVVNIKIDLLPRWFFFFKSRFLKA